MVEHMFCTNAVLETHTLSEPNGARSAAAWAAHAQLLRSVASFVLHARIAVLPCCWACAQDCVLLPRDPCLSSTPRKAHRACVVAVWQHAPATTCPKITLCEGGRKWAHVCVPMHVCVCECACVRAQRARSCTSGG